MKPLVAVACRQGNLIYTIPAPARHVDVIKAAQIMFLPDDQGFLGRDGLFYGRQEAAMIALKSEQIARLMYPPLLYSEDLW